ncbi:MAG TPA: phospholipase D family protein [Conexibacter sp.]|nr:phospholipase D family protein [Conexibacter sp.]
MAPTARFVGQPIAPDDTAACFLRDALAQPDVERLVIAVAWTRFGGLVRIADELRGFRARGGRARLITGIDEGGATRPGLALALLLFDDVMILHDAGGRTFHPKVYLAEGTSAARLLVGSSNLTAGGLYFNFEASVELRFSLPADGRDPALVGARAYLEALEGDACSDVLTPEALNVLAADPRYRIAATERRRVAADSDSRPTVDTDAAVDQPSVAFPPSSTATSFPPPLDGDQRRLRRELEGAASAPLPASRGPQPAVSAVARWTKILAPTDAQRPPKSGSNPTGNLRLVRARQPIDQTTWFRHELFARCDWQPRLDRRGNPIEVATVAMDVVVRGVALGALDITVDHAAHRESGQDNHTTVLHWGPVLGPMLRAADLTGATLAIVRLVDGTFRLTIS